jgi:hypothetical protein
MIAQVKLLGWTFLKEYDMIKALSELLDIFINIYYN